MIADCVSSVHKHLFISFRMTLYYKAFSISGLARLHVLYGEQKSAAKYIRTLAYTFHYDHRKSTLLHKP